MVKKIHRIPGGLYPKDKSNTYKYLGVFLDSYFRDIPLESMRNATQETCKFVERNMQLVEWASDRWAVLKKAIETVTVKNGIWMELGVYSGQTINFIAKRSRGNIVYGLDSFKGLSETWRVDFPKGMYATQKSPKVDKNVTLIKGFFSETLPKILEQDKRNLAFLHIDCDLYSSTKSAFDYLESRIVPGTVFVFDEFFNYPGWKKHEYKAFHELVSKNNFKYTYLCYARAHSQVAVQFV